MTVTLGREQVHQGRKVPQEGQQFPHILAVAQYSVSIKADMTGTKGFTVLFVGDKRQAGRLPFLGPKVPVGEASPGLKEGQQ